MDILNAACRMIEMKIMPTIALKQTDRNTFSISERIQSAFFAIRFKIFTARYALSPFMQAFFVLSE